MIFSRDDGNELTLGFGFSMMVGAGSKAKN
jgi:hypothetical protein